MPFEVLVVCCFLILAPLLFRTQLFIYGLAVYYYDVFAEIVLFGEQQSDLTYFKKNRCGSERRRLAKEHS